MIAAKTAYVDDRIVIKSREIVLDDLGLRQVGLGFDSGTLAVLDFLERCVPAHPGAGCALPSSLDESTASTSSN
jgi:hypothetical protein